MRPSRRNGRGLAALIAAGALFGCGSEPASTAGASPTPPSPRSTPETQADADVASNSAPVVERVTLTPAEPSAHDTLKANVEVSDADGDRAVVQYTWWVNGRRVGEGTSLELAGTRRGAKIEVSVVADDGHAQSEPVTASAMLGNSEPRIESIRFEPSGPWMANRSRAALPEAVDPDGDPLTFEYAWYVNARRLEESGPTIGGEELKRGDRVVLVVVASDGYAESDELRTEEFEVSNSSPEITSTPGAIGPDGYFRYQVHATDPDGDRAFMYRLLKSPAGMNVDVLGGNIVWQPNSAHTGTHTIEVEVDDRMGGKATQSFTLNVSFDDTPPASPN